MMERLINMIIILTGFDSLDKARLAVRKCLSILTSLAHSWNCRPHNFEGGNYEHFAPFWDLSVTIFQWVSSSLTDSTITCYCSIVKSLKKYVCT